jgi:putative acetyltransferase
MGEVSLAVEDPRDAPVAAMLGELITFIKDLYPEDEDDPPSPWTVDDLAREDTFVVARVDGAVAGCGGLVATNLPGAMEVVRRYVRPDHRGLRLGDRVLAELEALARRRGVERLVLRCGPRQPPALRLYERNGYTLRAAFAQHREHPTNLFYEKRVD